jgi:hypothetical protein
MIILQLGGCPDPSKKHSSREGYMHFSQYALNIFSDIPLGIKIFICHISSKTWAGSDVVGHIVEDPLEKPWLHSASEAQRWEAAERNTPRI